MPDRTRDNHQANLSIRQLCMWWRTLTRGYKIFLTCMEASLMTKLILYSSQVDTTHVNVTRMPRWGPTLTFLPALLQVSSKLLLHRGQHHQCMAAQKERKKHVQLLGLFLHSLKSCDMWKYEYPVAAHFMLRLFRNWLCPPCLTLCNNKLTIFGNHRWPCILKSVSQHDPGKTGSDLLWCLSVLFRVCFLCLLLCAGCFIVLWWAPQVVQFSEASSVHLDWWCCKVLGSPLSPVSSPLTMTFHSECYAFCFICMLLYTVYWRWI